MDVHFYSSFWSEEKKRLKNGESGTRNWSDKQKEDIIGNKGRTTYDGEPMEGHHKYNAKDYPQISDKPDNIYPAINREHRRRWHNNNTKHETKGQPLNPNFKEEF